MKLSLASILLVIAAACATAATAPTAPANLANRGIAVTIQSDEGHPAPDDTVPPPKPKPHPRHVSKHR